MTPYRKNLHYIVYDRQGEKVSKKEKNIEVNVKDVEQNGQPVQQVFIGSALIGEVAADGSKFAATMAASNQQFTVQSQEEGLETILQQYHLHQH
jgi:hypothetical protein